LSVIYEQLSKTFYNKSDFFTINFDMPFGICRQKLKRLPTRNGWHNGCPVIILPKIFTDNRLLFSEISGKVFEDALTQNKI